MPVQDLTPQLRTRLSRVERAVGWFVIVATALLLAGFAYYLHHIADRKGWFKIKVQYHTFVRSGAGLHEGDPVKLLGFDVGAITRITAMPPFSEAGNVYIQFVVLEPFYGYIWDDSKAKVTTADFLGKRTIEVLQGGLSGRTNLHPTYKIEKDKVTAIWNPHAGPSGDWANYTKDSKGYTLEADESPALGDRLESVANQVEKALPGILSLTNYLADLLTNATRLSVRADAALVQTQPLLSNVTLISSMLTNQNGSLGNWILPTNLSSQLELTLAEAQATLKSANTNVTSVATGLDSTLVYLANITSNLNQQVSTNDQIVSQVSSVIVHADDLVQGLKKHWLLRSAFKSEKPATNDTPAKPPAPSPGRPEAGSKTGKR